MCGSRQAARVVPWAFRTRGRQRCVGESEAQKINCVTSIKEYDASTGDFFLTDIGKHVCGLQHKIFDAARSQCQQALDHAWCFDYSQPADPHIGCARDMPSLSERCIEGPGVKTGIDVTCADKHDVRRLLCSGCNLSVQ